MSIRHTITRFFAVIGLLATLSTALTGFALWRYFAAEPAEPDAPEEIILALDFTIPVAERLSDFSLSIPALLEEGGETSLLYIIRALENAATDPKVKGVVAKFGFEPLDLVHVQEIATSLEKLRASGKFTYAYAPSYGDFGAGSSIYSLASHFDAIWLQPIGAVAFSPLSIEAPFGKTALENFGIKTDFLRREDYKSVMENVSRDNFSAPVRANMESMLSNLNEQIAAQVAQGRKIDPAQAKALLAQGPFTSNEALKAGLVTRLGYSDEIEKEVEEKAGKEAEVLDPYSYMYYFNKSREDEPKSTIAVIYADGMIADEPHSLAEEEIIDTGAIIGAFEDAAEDEDVKAILFRVNSPGGSPVASEAIRRALIKAKESKKPIYVSMGTVAASGGYWIAMDADRIFANPATITGSIGVIAGKFVLGGLFDKLGVKFDTIGEGKDSAASLWSPRTPFDEKGRARMNAMIDETYNAFVGNVAAARKIPLEKMPDVAKGRVFTGAQALKVGLADELGGIDATIQALKTKIGLAAGDRVYLQQFPPPETPETLVIRMLKNIRFGGAMVMDLSRQLQEIRAALAPLTAALGDQGKISAKLPIGDFVAR